MCQLLSSLKDLVETKSKGFSFPSSVTKQDCARKVYDGGRRVEGKKSWSVLREDFEHSVV